MQVKCSIQLVKKEEPTTTSPQTIYLTTRHPEFLGILLSQTLLIGLNLIFKYYRINWVRVPTDSISAP